MAFLGKTSNILKKFKRDESGITSMVWALCVTGFITAAGAAVDFAILSGADARSQSIADTTALAAAIYVKNFEQVPEDRTKGLIGEYTANELGYDYKNWVIGGSEGVDINVTYDNVNREATVTVSGQTRPTLMQILGYEALDFGAKSVVKYYEKDIQDPASVLMILDNSGSMAFDDLPINSDGTSPTDATRRMDGLTASADMFLNMLDDTVGPQLESNSDPRVLRTGMLAFDDEIISNRTVQMDWGTIPRSNITSMTPRNATNSTPPLTLANTWLNVNEPAFHEVENPGKTPLKYVILMTDGKNSGDLEWVNRTGTETWRRYVTNATSPIGLDEVTSSEVEVTPENCTTTFSDRWNYVCQYSDSNGNNWSNIYRSNITTEWNPQSGSYSYRTGRRRNRRTVTVNYNCASQVTAPAETEVCTPAETETRYSGYEYGYGEQAPDNSGDWVEGEQDVPANVASRAQCDTLHNAGVEVFTIGFALVPGQFETNEWANRSANHYTPYPKADEPEWYENSVKSTNLAKGMLQYCASRDENFITADNVTALDAAFDRIGNTIIKEIIRISS